MKIRHCMLALATAAVATTAMAKDSVSDTMRNSLINEQGYAELTEGFFMKRIGLEESYLAVGAAGNQAMVEKLVESRNASQQAIAKQGGDASKVVAKYDALIGQFNAPEPKLTGGQAGDCSGRQGSPDFYVSAQSSGGNFALANAINYVGIVNTTNRTDVWTTNRNGNLTSEQASTTYGAAPSNSLVSITDNGTACEAVASASITCPGAKYPALSIFINHLKWWDCRN